jgi:hypothetical protein
VKVDLRTLLAWMIGLWNGSSQAQLIPGAISTRETAAMRCLDERPLFDRDRLPDWVIQAQVGHVAPEMMKTYSHIRREALNQAAAALEPTRPVAPAPTQPPTAAPTGKEKRVMSQPMSQKRNSKGRVLSFPRESGSSGWIRTSNPPVNRLMQVTYLVGSSWVWLGWTPVSYPVFGNELITN